MEDLERNKQYSNSEVYCNCCGRVISETGNSKEDYLQVKKAWGYFSSKDLTGHAFNMCEMCYDKMIANFKVPVEEFPVDEIPNYSDEELERLNAAYTAELCKKQ